MPNQNGEKFQCYLPKFEESKYGKSIPQQNMSSLIMETEKQVKLKTPDELLEVLKDRCFIRVRIYRQDFFSMSSTKKLFFNSDTANH